MWWNVVVEFVWPRKCVVCGCEDEDLCRSCLLELEYADQICPECGDESEFGWTHEWCRKRYGLDGLIGIFSYRDGKVKTVVSKIKFGFNQRLIKILGESCVFEIGEPFDMVVSIPLHRYRKNWRGFNQSEVLGRLVAEKLKIEYSEMLTRVRNTPQMALVEKKEERQKLIESAFRLKEEWSDPIKQKRILLVDDVFTSGSTMKECTKVLKKSGAKSVWGLVLAH